MSSLEMLNQNISELNAKASEISNNQKRDLAYRWYFTQEKTKQMDISKAGSYTIFSERHKIDVSYNGSWYTIYFSEPTDVDSYDIIDLRLIRFDDDKYISINGVKVKVSKGVGKMRVARDSHGDYLIFTNSNVVTYASGCKKLIYFEDSKVVVRDRHYTGCCFKHLFTDFLCCLPFAMMSALKYCCCETSCSNPIVTEEEFKSFNIQAHWKYEEWNSVCSFGQKRYWLI